ncbi:MAG TPA: glycosyltransferase [Acetobacteraceae bacterium]|nr:glycosyltransferase [Acetobacteraceae bacterium]
MRVLVWQWGRRGAGPRVAAELARAFNKVPGTHAVLSLSARAELLASSDRPPCALQVPTYTGVTGFLTRVALSPLTVPGLRRWVRAYGIDVAVCAMPAPMDFAMGAALRLAGVPFAVVVHDADLHPGDAFPMQIKLQRWLLQGAAGVFALSTHVAERLREQRLTDGKRLMLASLPPFVYGPAPPPPRAHGGKLRLLSFGRLLPYKGLDLLADALAALGPRGDLELRVVGSGPESPELDQLRALPGVCVENRWVPEEEVGALLAWSDALVLSHREASQSGVAAAAIAARRWLIATRVGGLAEQLGNEKMALLCDPAPASLAAAMAKLLDMNGDGEHIPASPNPRAAWAGVAESMVTGLRGLWAHAKKPSPLGRGLV